MVSFSIGSTLQVALKSGTSSVGDSVDWSGAFVLSNRDYAIAADLTPSRFQQNINKMCNLIT
jgi:vacuolar-type H+-ATPase subunit E/Vma4